MANAAPLRLWLPALDRFATDGPLRQALARADRMEPGLRGYLDNLAQLFQTDAALPAAALTRNLLLGDAGSDLWLAADPCWLQPDMNGARLLACGQMGLDTAAAEALAETLRPVFAQAGFELLISSPDSWHLRLPPGTVLPAFAAPEQALGEQVLQHLPEGAAGKIWRVLLNEIQVLLHQHPLNAQRQSQGQPPINSVWLWGGGVLGEVTTSLRGVVGDELLLRALGKRAGVVALPGSTESIEKAGAEWLVDWQDRSVEWIDKSSPATALLREQVVLVQAASGERWLHRPWHRWRRWRKARS